MILKKGHFYIVTMKRSNNAGTNIYLSECVDIAADFRDKDEYHMTDVALLEGVPFIDEGKDWVYSNVDNIDLEEVKKEDYLEYFL